MKHEYGAVKRLALYYLSGTGNTLRTAFWIKDKAEELGYCAELHPVEGCLRERGVSVSSGEIIGIGMPVHGFTIPWMMLKFILRLPRQKDSKAFVWATRAGAKYGPLPWYPPGIAGSSIFIAALILFFKGYNVRGMISVNMPSNWMSLHSGLRSDIISTILTKTEPEIKEFSDRIFSGRRVLISANIIYEFICAVSLSVFSALYLFIGRFSLAKMFFANSSCTGCGICAKNCPTGSIKMLGRKEPLPYWSFTCESCMRCMGYCPHNAIEASQSLLAVVWFVIIHFPLSAFLFSFIVRLTEWNSGIGFKMIDPAVFIIYSFFTIFTFYIIFWLLNRIPFFCKIFTYTTLTHIYRRYHAPGISLKDLRGIEKD